jgi:hypothetical protein
LDGIDMDRFICDDFPNYAVGASLNALTDFSLIVKEGSWYFWGLISGIR